MSSLMMPVFKRGQLGTVMARMIGAEQWDYYRAQGWYDADDKVPLNPGQVAEVVQPEPVYTAPVKPYGAFGTVVGEAAPARRPGRPVGSKNGSGKR